MNRIITFKSFLRPVNLDCIQSRSYAIMDRAKQRAGIPVNQPSNLLKTKKTKKIESTQEVAKVNTKTNVKRTDQEKRDIVKSQLVNMNLRKPAGITERLIKVNKDIVQPENPHLIKVAVIGSANAGKSTLVNKIIGEDVSGVSPKAHTTRERILAIHTEGNHQVVFLDTPGVIPDHNHAKMNRTLATSSWRSLDEADHILIVVDANRSLQPKASIAENFILEKLENETIPATLIFNKMDLINENRELLDEIKERYFQKYPYFKNVVYSTAIHEEGLEKVKAILFEESPQKPWIYAADQKTEMSELKRVEEIIRVEFFKRLHQYIPYMLKQENVGWTVLRDGTLRIDQNVYVERDSQQRIVVGYKGRIIDSVIEHARDQISRAFKKPVKLFIQIKTKKSTVN